MFCLSAADRGRGLTGLLGLAEGVQLLCLIDKAADACRYLQTYGEWSRAAWLAKVGAPVGALSTWVETLILNLILEI